MTVLTDLLKELNRRRVGRVAVAYVVVGWLLAQVAEFATSTFAAPPWVLKTFVVFLVLGLPVAIVLAWAFDLTSHGVRPADKAPPDEQSDGAARGGSRVLFAAFVLVTVSAAAWLQFYGPEPGARPPNVMGDAAATPTDLSFHYDLAFPEDAPLALIGAAELGNGKPAFAISPDGRLVVYVGASDGSYHLYLRNLVTGSTKRLEGTDNAFHPFFAPNGLWIGFFVANDLYKVSINGGDPVFLSPATNSVGADWTEDDRIVMSLEEGSIIVEVPGSGGTPREVDSPVSALYLSTVPGLDKIIAGGSLIDLATGDAAEIPIRSNDIRYVGGYLFHALQGSLFASRYEPASNRLAGSPVPVITGVRTEIWGAAQWSVSETGTLVYMPGGDARANPMRWVSAAESGDIELPIRIRGSMEIAPDGQRVAVLETNDLQSDIWVYALDGSAALKVTTDGNSVQPIFWAPDGQSVYHQRDEDGNRFTVRTYINSQRPPQRALPEDLDYNGTSISTDGRYLGLAGAAGVGVYDLVEERLTRIPTASPEDWGTAIAPDGTAVVYTSSATGAYHNFLQPVPPTGEQFQVSDRLGGEEPRWRPDGSGVYFRSGSRIMLADVTLEPEIRVSRPRVFYAGVFENVSGRSFDVHPDGERALVIQSEDLASSIRLVTNWFADVEKIIGESE